MSYSTTGDNDSNDTHEIFSDWLAEDEDMIECPGCDGRGMDRWETDECLVCWGDGVVPRG